MGYREDISAENELNAETQYQMSEDSSITASSVAQDFKLVAVREKSILFPYKAKNTAEDYRFETIDEVLDSFLGLVSIDDVPAKALVIRSGVGSGKTYKTIRSLSQSIQSGVIATPVLHFVLDHKTALEAKAFYAEFGVDAFHLKGRRAAGCERIDIVEQYYQNGLSTKGLCATASLQSPSEEGRCPFFDGCEWIKTRLELQHEVSHPVVIAPMEYLRSGGLPKGLSPSLVVFDEGFFSKLLQADRLPVSDFGKPWEASAHGQDSDTAGALSKAERNVVDQATKMVLILAGQGKLTLSAFAESIDDETKALFVQASRLRRKELRTLGARAGSLTKNSKSRKAGTKKSSAPSSAIQKIEMSLWESLAELCDGQQIASETSAPTRPAQFHAILSDSRAMLDISSLRKLSFPCPVIALDASADEAIYRHVLEESHEVYFEQLPEKEDKLHRIAIIGQGFSTSSLIYEGDASYKSGHQTRKPQEEAAKRKEDLEKALNVISDNEAGRKVLVCTTKAIEDMFLTTGFAEEFQDRCQPTFIHFGQSKGVNSYDDFESIIVIGKLEIPSKAMILMSRAFHLADKAMAIKDEYLPKQRQQRILRTRDGRGANLTTFTYKDKTASRLHGYYRDEEIYQAIGRLRSVNRLDEDLRCYILSDAIPDHMVFDDILALDDLTSDGLIMNISKSYDACISATAYIEHQHCSKQAASDALKKRGFIGPNSPQGWYAYKCRIKGRSGPPHYIYCSEKGISAQGKVRSHFAQITGFNEDDVYIIEPVTPKS